MKGIILSIIFIVGMAVVTGTVAYQLGRFSAIHLTPVK